MQKASSTKRNPNPVLVTEVVFFLPRLRERWPFQGEGGTHCLPQRSGETGTALPFFAAANGWWSCETGRPVCAPGYSFRWIGLLCVRVRRVCGEGINDRSLGAGKPFPRQHFPCRNTPRPNAAYRHEGYGTVFGEESPAATPAVAPSVCLVLTREHPTILFRGRHHWTPGPGPDRDLMDVHVCFLFPCLNSHPSICKVGENIGQPVQTMGIGVETLFFDDY